MHLGEKIKHLREIEGELRGHNRPLTQMEVVKAMHEELGESISQAYLSQIESAKRLHLTASTRSLLARFFKVHPGYLVSDPPNFSTDLVTDLGTSHDERLETWLRAGAEEWRSEPALHDLLLHIADSRNPHQTIEMLAILSQFSLDELADLLGKEHHSSE